MIVLGSGGHTAEMIALVSNLSSRKYGPVDWVLAATDKTSLPKLQAASQELSTHQESSDENSSILSDTSEWSFHEIPRAREVGQSFLTSLPSTLRASLHGLVLVLRRRPHLCLLNGPGTCIPIAIGAVLLRIVTLNRCRPRIVFVESFCRTKSLSMTGKLLYRVADEFIVQWPQLEEKYGPRAKYLGVIY